MPEEEIVCDHCHLSFPKSMMMSQKEPDGTIKYFCCTGCQGVYNLLNAQGLESFYEKSKAQKLTPVSKEFEESSSFDKPGFLEEFAKKDGELLEIALILEGIHCAACVWLNEKVLYETEGVLDVSINFSTNKAKIVWDPEVVKLSKIIDTIRAIGYDAYAYDPKVSENKTQKRKKEYYTRLIVAVFATMNIMWIAIAQYAGFFLGMEKSYKNILNVAEFVLATPVLFYSGWVFFRGAYFGLKHRFVNMDLLVATGATLTYIYSLYIMVTQSGEAYFDSVAMIITFVLLGKFFEVLSKKQASDTLDKLNRHIPMEVVRLNAKGKESVSVHDIKEGDILELKAGERFAVDAKLLSDRVYVDESTITGENEPVLKQKGDHLISGTSNLNATIEVEVLKPYAQSTFSKLLNLLDEALTKKPAIEQLANRISGHFSTAILLLSLLTFLVWFTAFDESFARSFMVAVSVIVIACPCALALATPVATLVGVSLGAKKGILFKEAAHLETMAKSNRLFLDKTGTLTKGDYEVVKAHEHEGFEAHSLLALLEHSKHPVAKAVRRYYTQNKAVHAFDHVQVDAGLGVMGLYQGKRYLGGNRALLEAYGVKCPPYEGKHSLFYFACDGMILAWYELDDPIREGVPELLAYVKEHNIDVAMLTGDHKGAALELAKRLDIKDVHYELKPEDKAELILASRKNGDTVVMAGDGINDVLALAHANIAIGMGHGADVAVDSSDVVLLHDDMYALKEAFVISKKSFRLIKQNLSLSLIYNTITIPLAMLGFVIPLIAALSMSLSSLIVVGNALRIKYKA